jgi:exonuclease SbcD
VEWRRLDNVRKFVDRSIHLENQEGVTDRLRAALPPRLELEGAIVRLVVEYPRDWEALIDEAALREYTAECFEFHLVRRPRSDGRIRLPQNTSIGSFTPIELLDLYWGAVHVDAGERSALQALAEEIIQEIHGGLEK